VAPDNAFNLDSSDKSSASPYGKYCAQFNQEEQLGINQNDIFMNYGLRFSQNSILGFVRPSVCANGTGELSFTPLAVGQNNTLYLPGVSWNSYSCGRGESTNCDDDHTPGEPYFLSGIQQVRPNSMPVQAFQSHTHHVSGQDKEVGYQNRNRHGPGRASNQFFFSNRFVLRDEGQEITFAVANISDYFFKPNRFNHNSQSFVNYISSHDTPQKDTYCKGYGIPQTDPDVTPCEGQGDYTPEISDLLEANLETLTKYNSKVLVGTNVTTNQKSFINKNMQVNAVSVGKDVVFLAGSDNILYLFH
jgi:hypothetical protein